MLRRKDFRAPSAATSGLSCGPPGSTPCRPVVARAAPGWRSTPACRRSISGPTDRAARRRRRAAIRVAFLAVEAAGADTSPAPTGAKHCPAGRSRKPARLKNGTAQPARALVSVGRYGCTRADHQFDDLVVVLCLPRSWRHCGRCGTPCTGRQARQSRSCGAR